MPTILIVDDDDALRESIAETLADLGHRPVEASDGAAALARLARDEPIDAVLLDLRMPGMDGMEVLRRLHATAPALPVAVLTAVPTATNTIEAMRLGAVDHLAKPVGRADLAALLARMLPPDAAGRAPATEASGDEADLVGGSAAMREVQKAIGKLADSEATVLITGETGTGKEVVARAIHRHGRRAAKPFVAVNCAAIPSELLESQLFGHARGAFTGAVADRLGSFREANGGTLFLDEVGDMALPMQAKLLRVLQDRVVTPVGGRAVPVDVRILAATHRDLARAVKEGGFREDLFYRLGVVPVRLPPLRDRLADILPLAEHFLALLPGETGLRARRLSAAAAARLLAHPWPGNVRELRNAIERVAALARRPVITAADLCFLGEASGGNEATGEDWLAGELPAAVARLESEMIRRALAAADGNRAEAARRLGIHRQLLYEKLRKYGMEPSANRTESVGKADDLRE
jgi:two-component system NtrC family response regulator